MIPFSVPTDPFPSFDSVSNENIPPAVEFESPFVVPKVENKSRNNKESKKISMQPWSMSDFQIQNRAWCSPLNRNMHSSQFNSLY